MKAFIKKIITMIRRSTGIAAVFFISLIAGCDVYDGPVLSDARSFYIDLKDNIFNALDLENMEEQGLGVDAVRITVFTDEGRDTWTSFTVTVTDEDINTDDEWKYSQVELTISGELIGVTAEAGSFSAEIDEESGPWDLQGWTVFANLNKVKLDFTSSGDPGDPGRFRLVPCPCGLDAPVIKVDSGVQTGGSTDRQGELISGQIALEVEPAEFPGDLEYDVYTAVVGEDLSYEYNEAVNWEAFYHSHPWEDSWTYEEITATGKNIGENIYLLEKYNGDSRYSAADPLGDGKKAVILDLSDTGDSEITDKYLLAAVVLHFKGLAVPLDVLCIDIE